MNVSVITVCLNSAGTIEDTLRSVMVQDYANIEHIIVDGGSTDGTLDIIKSYDGSISQFICESDNGVYDAMNKGIKLSTGDIIAILNSDDVYASRSVVGEMVEFMEKHNLDAAYGDLLYIDRNNSNHVARFWKAGQYKRGAFYYGWAIPHPTFFCRKEVFEKHGYFNNDFQIAGDFELMLRFIEKHRINVGYLPKVIVKMRTGGIANRLSGIAQGNREIIEAFRVNDMKVSPSFFWRKPLMKLTQVARRCSAAW